MLYSSISATVALYNPPSGSSSLEPTPQEWQGDPSEGTEGLPVPSHTDPSYVLQPAYEWRAESWAHCYTLNSLSMPKIVSSLNLHNSHSPICDS